MTSILINIVTFMRLIRSTIWTHERNLIGWTIYREIFASTFALSSVLLQSMYKAIRG